MPSPGALLSGNALETAITVPYGALNLNLKHKSQSMKTSNVPFIALLLEKRRRVLCVILPRTVRSARTERVKET